MQQYPQPAGPAQPMQYPQTATAPPQSQGYGGGGIQGGYPVSPGSVQAGTGSQPMSPYSPNPSSQPTPIHVQGAPQQQSGTGGGLWSTLKDIFAPSNQVTSPPQRAGFGPRNRSSGDEL